CLALKKAADFYQSLPMPEPEAVSEMVAYAQEALRNAGYRPYYLYRQKNMAANLENVGYAKPGYESAYNVMMMDDSQTILGIGAGASTKVLGGRRGIERLTECKYPYDYLARFDELMQEKEKQLRALLG
ncbi:MAG: coproporphyrinogen dehydrogenase HemZ, partial [Oscillospiraceae bacterium]|nr:coproporphyrinogen dehydrogenase HemZ [Oscillospiraceae bacterium]